MEREDVELAVLKVAEAAYRMGAKDMRARAAKRAGGSAATDILGIVPVAAQPAWAGTIREVLRPLPPARLFWKEKGPSAAQVRRFGESYSWLVRDSSGVYNPVMTASEGFPAFADGSRVETYVGSWLLLDPDGQPVESWGPEEEDQLRRVGPPLVTCAECGKEKCPVGRSAPVAVAGDLCSVGNGCPGYYAEPYPDRLWPGEEE